MKKIGLPPGPRAGFSMCVHKKRVVFFGGVVDSEDTGTKKNEGNADDGQIHVDVKA